MDFSKSDAESQGHKSMEVEHINTLLQGENTQADDSNQQSIIQPFKEHLKAQKNNKEHLQQTVESVIERKHIERGFYNLLMHKADQRDKMMTEFHRKWKEIGFISGWSEDLMVMVDEEKKNTKRVFYRIVKDIALLWNNYATRPWKTLSMNITDWRGITDNGLKSITPYLKYCFKGLKGIDFSFSENNDISVRGYKDFVKQICQSFSDLSELGLSFSDMTIYDKEVDEIFGILREHKIPLQRIKVTFYYCKDLTARGVTSLLSHITNGLPNLSRLRLNFNGCEDIKGEVTQSLTQGLAPIISKLTEFDLTLKEFTYDDVTSGIIKELIPKANRLQNLKLTFASWEASDKLLQDLAAAFENNNFPDLEHLNLDFDQFDIEQLITDMAIDCLSNQIERENLKKLKTFCLDVSWNENITDQSVVRLVSAVRDNMLELIKLTLDFHRCQNLSAAVVRDSNLWNFRHLKKLQDCGASFVSCDNISEDDLNLLKEHLNYIETVRTGYV